MYGASCCLRSTWTPVAPFASDDGPGRRPLMELGRVNLETARKLTQALGGAVAWWASLCPSWVHWCARASVIVWASTGAGRLVRHFAPLGGGQEWEAQPEDLYPEVWGIARLVDVEQLHAAYGGHVRDCAGCAHGEACDMGRALWLVCEEAAGVAESVSLRSVSGVLSIPCGQPVPPCRFLCFICRIKRGASDVCLPERLVAALSATRGRAAGDESLCPAVTWVGARSL
jgi:hypothetical protein